MKFTDLFHISGFIYLMSLQELEDNSVSLILDLESAANADCQQVKIVFSSYVLYSVRNESYTSFDESEVYQGDLFRIYSTSEFLKYVRRSTFAEGAHPGLLQHYSIGSSNHIIDIATIHEPTITQVQ